MADSRQFEHFDPRPARLHLQQGFMREHVRPGAAAFEKSVCSCFKVGEAQIRAAVAAGATLAGLQKDLKCGTNCGSCVPELRRLAAA